MSAERLREAADRLDGGTLTLWYGRQVGGESFDAAPLAEWLRHEAQMCDFYDAGPAMDPLAVANAILGEGR